MASASHQIRVTGLLTRGGALLLVKQHVTASRQWSLPGGRAGAGETLEQAMIREMKEETGLDVAVGRLLYLCEMPDASPPLLHVSFLLSERGGTLTLPTNEHDENPITDVRFVPFASLPEYGFSHRFTALALAGFPGAGAYMGPKSAIGL